MADSSNQPASPAKARVEAVSPVEAKLSVCTIDTKPEDDEFDSDLGTPTSPKDAFGEDEREPGGMFANHVFYGPSGHKDSEHVLHDTRRVELNHPKLKLPYFKSEPQDAGRMSVIYGGPQSVTELPPARRSVMTMARSNLPKISKSLPGLPSFLSRTKKAPTDTDHAMAFCDGCGEHPIKGTVWSCSVCVNYNLCGLCYSQGIHGLENTPAMTMYQELTIHDKLKKRCKAMTSEFLGVLFRDICKMQPGKFEHLGNWLAGIIDKKTDASKIIARGVEIPGLSVEIRQNFMGLLMPLVSNRTDIQVYVEWVPDEAGPNLEKLRIWMSDQKTRTKTPFSQAVAQSVGAQ
ncbi:hypothetical protein SDRG_10571 [Saprolegnia diclina VS20]|uniref:ZZ-type domain-containing protein n=1 Tax=Saprolegnia diclina (strain VS20) TaxID=1156394 RepID=T0RNY3_SAPDV|nr:hypothetical protein SDRG_10571 [Saprolegnia diclina VS20]EQC31782.1 hypothetical protein SDRG_10571 [Saprolegnia diclina VS20]|eukprot:XP_008614789.1 hypothetical protein SDRG_10571 [Saprolegnia diclina VS20]